MVKGITMDMQLKRGLLDICVLASLATDDSYGYKIIKDVSSAIEISESTLYPILKRLEAGGYLTVYSVEHNSRLRKYYRLTESGKEKVLDFLREWGEVMNVYHFIQQQMMITESETIDEDEGTMINEDETETSYEKEEVI